MKASLQARCCEWRFFRGGFARRRDWKEFIRNRRRTYREWVQLWERSGMRSAKVNQLEGVE